MAEIIINGNKQNVAEGASLIEVLKENGFSEKSGIAVAIGTEIIPKSKWAEKRLSPGDKITVIQPTQGG